MKIDLHIHTTGSDGLLSPEEVVNLAAKRNLKIIAITDHNAVLGVSEAVEQGKGRGVKVVPGIEISSFIDKNEVEIHILGLGIDINSNHLRKVIKKIAAKSEKLLKSRLYLANKYFGSKITLKELRKKTIGIPSTRHIAISLRDKGYVSSIEEGKSIFMKKGPCAIKGDAKGIYVKEAIKAIHDSGGIALLAHLSKYRNLNKEFTFKEQERLIKKLASYGLDGIEIYVPETSKKDIKFGEKVAKKYNLLVSGGSDFHDEKSLPQNKLGFLDINKEKMTVLNALREA